MAPLGKPSKRIMINVIGRLTGKKSSRTIVGPRPGVDVSVLRIANGRVMIASCDPVSFIPSIGPTASARMSVYEVASDVATSGIPARYAMVDLNLPPQVSDRSLTNYWTSFHKTCRELGIAIAGGHTGRFKGCDFSIIGSATLWTTCGTDEYVTSMMAKDGDDLILTKSAAYGATSVLTRAFPRTVRKVLGAELYARARHYFFQSNTVKDAMVAASGGIRSRGVTAMHDATEGGVVAALLEIAEASGLGANVYIEDIPISEETRCLCKFFRIDPLISLGEGCLVIACRPTWSDSVLSRLRSNGVHARIVGRLSSKVRRVYGVTKKGSVAVRYPSQDPYWKAYWKAVGKGWS